MTKHQKILNLISLIRESHPEMTNIYIKGSCLNFFLILHSIYPEAEAWSNVDHIITKIDNYFYDITGAVNPRGYLKYDGKGFTQMQKYFYKSTNDWK